ncbi:MAG: hypothetical protein U9Q22_06785 [Candidatus Altiarchaeota archaeon]|nr:hypothetical protein [Candidatus Altiarchaeota archaeon]
MGDVNKLMVLFVLMVGILISGCVQKETESTTTSSTSSTTLQATSTTTSSTSSTTLQATTTSTTSTTTVISNLEMGIILSTDKETYHSNELMNITATINSSDEVRGVDIRVYGINAGFHRLNKTGGMNLDQGVNTRTVTYRTPRCYGCAGITPGTYMINADLVYNDKVVASSTIDVEIVRLLPI